MVAAIKLQEAVMLYYVHHTAPKVVFGKGENVTKRMIECDDLMDDGWRCSVAELLGHETGVQPAPVGTEGLRVYEVTAIGEEDGMPVLTGFLREPTIEEFQELIQGVWYE